MGFLFCQVRATFHEIPASSPFIFGKSSHFFFFPPRASSATVIQNEAVENDVRPALDNLVDDADRDVRYFARKAMQTVAAMG